MAKVKPTTKTCKHCATEIPYEAKVCPNCRKKVKGGKVKWILLAIVILGILGSLMGGGDDAEDTKPSDTNQAEVSQDVSEQQENQEIEQEVEKETKEEKTTEAPKIEYKKYNVTELFDDLKDNALKAEKLHQDEYVKITGYLGTIDSDGSYIGVGAAEDDYDYMFQEVQCYIQSDEQLDQVMELSKGDKITVKGQISSIGELMGYSLKIDKIKKAE